MKKKRRRWGRDFRKREYAGVRRVDGGLIRYRGPEHTTVTRVETCILTLPPVGLLYPRMRDAPVRMQSPQESVKDLHCTQEVRTSNYYMVTAIQPRTCWICHGWSKDCPPAPQHRRRARGPVTSAEVRLNLTQLTRQRKYKKQQTTCPLVLAPCLEGDTLVRVMRPRARAFAGASSPLGPGCLGLAVEQPVALPRAG